jgi:hypothetical protein
LHGEPRSHQGDASPLDPVVAALRAGDEAAFLALVSQHHAAMVRMAIAYVGSPTASPCLAIAPKAFEQAYRWLRRGGTLAFVALPGGQLPSSCRSSRPSSTDHAGELDRVRRRDREGADSGAAVFTR